MTPDKPNVSTDDGADSQMESKVHSFLVECKNSILDHVLSDEQKELRILKMIDNKRGKNIPLEGGEFRLLLKKKITLDGLFLDDNSFPGNNYLTEFNGQNFCNVVLDISKNYIFNNCDFSGAVFKSIAGNEVQFIDCNLQNAQLGVMIPGEITFTNCCIKGIDIGGNSYENCDDLKGYSGIMLRKMSSKKVTFASPFEDAFDTVCTKKINKKGILRIVNDNGEIHELKVLFRKARSLLGVVFMNTYKLGDDFLHKNVIYILDNVGDEKQNKLRTKIYNQIDLGRHHANYILFQENQDGEIVIDLKAKETDLVFKFVRPVLVDKKIGYNQDVRFGDYFEKFMSEEL